MLFHKTLTVLVRAVHCCVELSQHLISGGPHCADRFVKGGQKIRGEHSFFLPRGPQVSFDSVCWVVVVVLNIYLVGVGCRKDVGGG